MCILSGCRAISIHALVKRATYANKYTAKCGFISIHALVKRATSNKSIKDFIAKNFNPRPRKEGDLLQWRRGVYNVDFNPRPRKEGDYLMTISIIQQFHFNPRPRKEGDYV